MQNDLYKRGFENASFLGDAVYLNTWAFQVKTHTLTCITNRKQVYFYGSDSHFLSGQWLEKRLYYVPFTVFRNYDNFVNMLQHHHVGIPFIEGRLPAIICRPHRFANRKR